MAARVLHLDPEQVRGFARDVYSVADTLSKLTIDSVLLSGSRSCEGTALVAGLNRHATEQHSEVQKLSGDLDRLGDWLVYGANNIERVSGGPSATPPPSPGNPNL